MLYETFLITRSGPVATVTFNRPEKLNPINELVTRELLSIVHELREDEQTRVVILTGAGRAFSVGSDMEMFAESVDPAY
jgi:enoyl-CoA hydratase/carnithine racemase